MFEPKNLKAGDKNTSVLLLQEILKSRGFKGKNKKDLDLDWEAGDNTGCPTCITFNRIETITDYGGNKSCMGKCTVMIKDNNVTDFRVCVPGKQISQCWTVHVRPVFQQFFSFFQTKGFHKTPRYERRTPRLPLIGWFYISPIFRKISRSCVCCLTVKLTV